MNLSALKPATGSVKTKKRLGRGHGQSRSGYSQKSHFEGGQMPLQRRVPKFGFKNINRVEYKALNLDTIQALVEKTNVTVVDKEILYNNGLVSKTDLVKVLNRGELKAAVEVKVDAFSKTAVEAIEKAGGKAVTL